MGVMNNIRRIAFPMLLGGVIFLSGCGTPQSAKIAPDVASARTALTSAIDNDAEKYAPVELRGAREKLQDAQAAIDNKEFDKARQLTDKALVEARLASEKSRTAKSKEQTQTLKETVDTLRAELERMSQQ